MPWILELWDRGCNAPILTQARYDKDEIQQFALNLLLTSGMELEKARGVCEILVEGDLMGHTTDGLQMLIPYLKSIEAKTMTLSGTYSILRETPFTEHGEPRSANLLYQTSTGPLGTGMCSLRATAG